MLDFLLRKPTTCDDKYSRGVVGFVTGSQEYAGAALLGVSAAIRVGAGLVRYVGPDAVGSLLLEVRPEVILGAGRAQAWVLGSGVASTSASQIESMKHALATAESEFFVIDAGALDLVDSEFSLGARSILTPHIAEANRLADRLLGRTFAAEDRNELASQLAAATGSTVLLKGSRTLIASRDGLIECPSAPTELATAGTGDVLAGIIGGLLAINHESIQSGQVSLANVAQAAVSVHSKAAEILAAEGPIAALDLANTVGEALVALRG